MGFSHVMLGKTSALRMTFVLWRSVCVVTCCIPNVFWITAVAFSCHASWPVFFWQWVAHLTTAEWLVRHGDKNSCVQTQCHTWAYTRRFAHIATTKTTPCPAVGHSSFRPGHCAWLYYAYHRGMHLWCFRSVCTVTGDHMWALYMCIYWVYDNHSLQ